MTLGPWSLGVPVAVAAVLAIFSRSLQSSRLKKLFPDSSYLVFDPTNILALVLNNYITGSR